METFITNGYVKEGFTAETKPPQKAIPAIKKHNFILDANGYAKVVFTDETGKTHTRTNDFFVPPEHIAIVNSGKLTKDVLFDMEYAEMLRLATYKPASRIIEEYMGVRGVYLKNNHTSSDGIVKPTTIKPHQVKTLEWMRQREALSGDKDARGVRGGIVRLIMGLGKTLTALLHILSSKKGKFPSLIICSKTVMINWDVDGLRKFFGEGKNAPKVLYLHKDFMSQYELSCVNRDAILKYDIVITSYDTCLTACKKGGFDLQCIKRGAENTVMKGKIVSIHERQYDRADLPNLTGIQVIYGTQWERVICDESQKFANPNTMIYQYVMAIYGRYKWCLTGTPIRNYDTDIWAQLRFCGYTGVDKKGVWKEIGPLKFKTDELNKAIFSMDYKDAGEKLPPKTKYFDNVTLHGKQLDVYNFAFNKTRDAYDKMMQKMCSFSCVLAMFTRLRQCAIAPYLITAESKREKMNGETAKGDREALDIIKNMVDIGDGGLGKWCHDRDGEAGIYSAKISKIIYTIKKIPENEKVLVFSSFTSCLDLLSYALEVRLPNFKFVQIDGDTKGFDRMALLNRFNKEDNIRGAFFTYKVGGEGLNLTVATHCICIEPWWTPVAPSQAEARLWRIGQTKHVHIHTIIVSDTLEDRIIAMCNEKREMADHYLEGSERKMKNTSLDKYTIGLMLGIKN